MKALTLTSQSNRSPRKKTLPAFVSETELVAAKQQRFQEVFGGVDWEQAKRTIAEAKAAAR